MVTCAHGNASDVGKALCDSPDVGVMSFTGSSRVGKILYRQCAGTVKKLAMELGGYCRGFTPLLPDRGLGNLEKMA